MEMNETLEKLYHGHIFPEEKSRPQCEKYKQALKSSANKQQKFLNKLNPELQTEFFDILNSIADMAPLELEDMFETGFCLGVRLTSEAFQKKI